jgi:hypothetical protein
MKFDYNLCVIGEALEVLRLPNRVLAMVSVLRFAVRMGVTKKDFDQLSAFILRLQKIFLLCDK